MRPVGLAQRSRGALDHLEWDNTCPSVQWKHSHNFVHHKFTNVVGMDDDVGYGILRVTATRNGRRGTLGNPIYNFLLGTFFEVGVALHTSSGRCRNKEKAYMGGQGPAAHRQEGG